MAAKELADYFFREYEWIPRDKYHFLLFSIRRNMEMGWVKWHGFIDEDGEMHNGWVLYEHVTGDHKGYKPVLYSHYDKHLLESGHVYQPLIQESGRGLYGYNCQTCNQLDKAKQATEALITQARIEQTQKLAAGIHAITKSKQPTEIERFMAGELCKLEEASK